MAVTFTRQPNLYTQSDNPVYFEFSSTNTAQNNFSFIVKVFVNNIQISERQIYPTNGTSAYYDAVNEARNSSLIPTFNDDILTNANNNTELFIEVQERYGTTPVTQPTVYSSFTIIVWKAKISNYDFINYQSTSIDNVFITDYSFTRKVRYAEQLRFMVANKTANFDLVVKSYLSNGTLTGTITESYSNTNQFTFINVSPNVIDESTALPILSCDYFTIECNNGYTVPAMRIDINFDCKQTTGRRLHWISQMGAIESFSFDLVSKLNSSIESFGYKKPFFKPALNTNPQEGEDVDTIKRRENKLKLTSNWLTDVEHELITRDLYFSPVVWIEENNGFILRRVKITNTSSERKLIENDMVFNEMVEISLGTETSMLA